jgi:hypothetical protein
VLHDSSFNRPIQEVNWMILIIFQFICQISANYDLRRRVSADNPLMEDLIDNHFTQGLSLAIRC